MCGCTEFTEPTQDCGTCNPAVTRGPAGWAHAPPLAGVDRRAAVVRVLRRERRKCGALVRALPVGAALAAAHPDAARLGAARLRGRSARSRARSEVPRRRRCR